MSLIIIVPCFVGCLLDSFCCQYYFNSSGIPLAMDIVQYYTNGTDKSVIHASLWQYVYINYISISNVLSGCYATDSGYNCTATCESAWFKIWNPKAAYSKADVCDRAFIGHYQNVMYEMYCFETIGNTIAKLEELIISGMRKVGSVKAILMLSL